MSDDIQSFVTYAALMRHVRHDNEVEVAKVLEGDMIEIPNYGRNPLRSAIDERAYKALRLLLQSRWYWSENTTENFMLLQYAVGMYKATAVRLLLEHGYPIKIDDDTETLLKKIVMSIQWSSTIDDDEEGDKERVDILKSLLDHGAFQHEAHPSPMLATIDPCINMIPVIMMLDAGFSPFIQLYGGGSSLYDILILYRRNYSARKVLNHIHKCQSLMSVVLGRRLDNRIISRDNKRPRP